MRWILYFVVLFLLAPQLQWTYKYPNASISVSDPCISSVESYKSEPWGCTYTDVTLEGSWLKQSYILTSKNGYSFPVGKPIFNGISSVDESGNVVFENVAIPGYGYYQIKWYEAATYRTYLILFGLLFMLIGVPVLAVRRMWKGTKP